MESKWSGSGGAGGGGDVFGPASSTDNAVPRFDGTTGDTLKDSGVIIDDSNNVTGVADLTATGDVSATNASVSGDITVDAGGAKEMAVGEELFDIIGTGVDTWAGFTITGGGSTFTIGAGNGHIAKHITDQFYAVTWSALTGNSPLTANGVTYVYIDTDGSASLTTTYPTPSERRQKILLGRVVTVASTIVQTVSMASVAQDAPNAVQDLAYGIGVFNIEGNEFSANGANLKLNKSAGKLYSPGANFLTSSDNPNWVTTGSATAATFAYITQAAGSTGSNTTDVVPGSYDNAGTVTAIPGGSNQATNQRIYLFPSGNIRIAYGQTIYASLTAAIQGIATESWTTNPSIPGNGVLVAVLSVTKGCTDLSVSTNARFFRASRFGEVSVGAAGGGTTTLQQAYNNATTPEIITDSTRGALTVQRGSAADTDNVLEVQNGSGTAQFTVKGNGNVETQGNLIVQGDLTVNGTTTTLNTQTLDVEDANIRINKGGNDTSAEGAGLSVEGTGGATRGTIQYEAALGSKWKLGASGAEDEVVTRTLSQTLTNKTLTTPVISQISNTGTLTLPTSTDTLVGRATNDTLSNKTLDNPVIDNSLTMLHESTPSAPASGRVRVYPKSDNSLYVLDSNGVETVVGSGTAAGFVNYITNPNAESSTTGWATYADAAASTPTDGTGGSPNVTWTRNTSVPIRGNADFAFAKDAANRQGQGVSFAFTIAISDRSKKCQISFDYDTTSVNYAAGDMRVYVYDVTNATLITPQTVDIPRGTNTFVTTFDTTTSTSYRLILHVATTNASSYTVDFDNFVVNAGQVVQGAAISSPQSWTPTGSWTTNTTYTGDYTRVGNFGNFHVRISLSGSPTAATLTVNMPSGLTIDTSLVNVVVGTNTFGRAHANANGTAMNFSVVSTGSASTVQLYYQSTASSTSSAMSGVTNTAPISWTSPSTIDLYWTVPVAEWSGSGTVNLGPGAQVEYAYNTDTSATASVTASGFANGPSGIAFSSNFTVGTSYTRRVRFQYPVQADDLIILEVAESGTPNQFVPYEQRLFPFSRQSGTEYGARIQAVSGSTTDYDVILASGGFRSDGGTLGVNGTGFSALTGFLWRVRKAKASSPVGFGLAGTDGSSGLYQAGRAPGLVTGAAVPAGYIGEIIRANTGPASVPTTGQYGDGSSITLTAGIWRIDAAYFVDRNTATLASNTSFAHGVSVTSGNSSTGLVRGINEAFTTIGGSTTLTSFSAAPISFLVRCDGTTITRIDDNTAFGAGLTLYHKIYVDNYSAATPQYRDKLTATRIA